MRNQILARDAAREWSRKTGRNIMTAEIGNNQGDTVVAVGSDRVWVMLHGDRNQPVRAINKGGVPTTAGIIVFVEYVKTTGVATYQILSRANATYPVDPWENTVGVHGAQHERRNFGAGGFDPVNSWTRMSPELRARQQATPDMTVYVEVGNYPMFGAEVIWSGGNSPAVTVPANPGESRCDLLYLDPANVLTFANGTAAVVADPLTSAKPTNPTGGYFPIAYIYTTNGQTTITEYNISDARLHFVGAGTSTLGALSAKNPPIDADKVVYQDSTAGDALVTSTWTQIKAFLKTYFDSLYSAIGTLAGHAIKEEGGAALTQRANLNFIGASVTATDNAGTDSTDITITGGGGAGDFVGPAGATAGNLVEFGDATGKLGADSGIASADVVAIADVAVRYQSAPPISAIVIGDGGGGDVRGAYAVDLQSSRSAVGQVASGGYSAILSGINNVANASSSIVVGGNGNTASGLYSGVVSGTANIASNTSAFVMGGNGNTASGYFSMVGCGVSNVASGRASFVGSGGYLATGNTASGSYSFIGSGVGNRASAADTFIGSGYVNVASGNCAVIGSGFLNTASGNYSSVSGGSLSVASGKFSMAGGEGGKARLSHTINYGAVNIIRKDDDAIATYPAYPSVEIIEMLLDVDLLTPADYSIAFPTGAHFWIDDMGLICTVIGGAIATAVINAPGAGYTVGDDLTIVGGGNDATFNVDSVGAGLGDVTGVTPNALGAGYTVGDQLTVTGGAADAVLNVDSVQLGDILTVAPNAPGVTYLAGDQLGVVGGNNDAIVNVDSVDGGGGVTGVSIVAAGTGYADAAGVATTTIGTGDGNATIDITTTVLGGVTGLSIVTPGTLYVTGTGVAMTGGTGDGNATVDIIATLWGDVATLTILAPGTAYVGALNVPTINGTGIGCTVDTTNTNTMTVQPTVSFGIIGTTAKHLAAVITTNLTTAFKRERYFPLVPQDGETSISFSVTTGATADLMRGRAYFKGMLVEDE